MAINILEKSQQISNSKNHKETSIRLQRKPDTAGYFGICFLEFVIFNNCLFKKGATLW